MTLDPTNPATGNEPGLWARSWALDGARGYGVRINVDDWAWTLDAGQATAYAAMLVRRGVEAEHDVAVFRLLTERLGLPVMVAAQVVIDDLRPDRVLDHSATHPLELTPGSALDPDVAGGVRPFIAMHIDGERVGQLTAADARDHAVAVLRGLAAADLDAALRRLLVGPIDLDEARASAVIASLADHWPAAEEPRR